MVNVEIIMKIARQARKAGDLQRAVNILSGGLCTDMENRTKVLIERAKILSIMEDFRCVLHDSREITTIDPTNYRGYNHAAIGAHGCYRFDDAMIYLHTGLEKADEPMSLIVRLRIMLELEDYKDFVNDIVNAESKSSLASLANNGDNEFNKVYKALMDGSDEAFVVFRAVAFSVKGSGEKAREIVTVAVLDRPNNRSLTAIQEFLMNPNDQVELTRRDVNFELEDSPSDLDADNNELYSNGDEEEVGAADDSADEDAVDEGNEADNDHDGLNNNEFPGFEDEDVDFDDDDDEDEDEEGDGGVEVEERADSGLGEDNDLISEQEGLGVSAFDARCKMATKKLMNGDFRLAYEHFRSAEMHVGADVGAGDAAEYGVFRYCLAYSRMKLQTSDITVVQDCMTTFQESLLAFPNHGLALLGHVGTCEAKRMLNFVKDFQDLQDEGLALLEKHDFTPVKYPGSDEVIPESTAEGFKRFVDDWAELVRHQPESVAKCLHSPCGALKPEIYANDLDFKGYIELKCTERCVLQFHPSCWKQELKSRIGGSDTLGAKCWTPDCEGTVVVYNGYDEKNELSVHRSKEVAEKKTKAKKQPTHQKQHKKKEDMKRGKKKNKSGKVEEEHSTDEEKEEPERGAEKHPSVEPEPRRGSRAKEEPQQQALAAKEHQQQQQQQQVHAPKEHQRQQQHQQQQQQQQQQPAGATAAPAGATAALNPGEIPWESMRRVVRSDDEDEKKVEQQQQQRGGKKDRKKRKQQQQQQQQQAELIKIQFTGPRRQLLSADGGIVQQQAAEEPVAAAPSLPVLVPPVADSAAAFPSIGEACPPDGPREDPELVKKLSMLVKLLTDHLRVNGPTKLSKLEEFVAECDRQVQVRIADQGGLKPYLCRAIAVEFYDDYVSLPGDTDRMKREYRKIWKMNPVFTEHILQSLEEGASVSDDFGSVDRLESPFQEIADEEEDIPSEEPVVMVSQAEQETDSDEGNVESAVNAALEEVEHQEMMTMQQQQDVQVEREVLDEKQQEEEKQEEKKDEEEEDYDDDLFQELLGERLAALERLKGQVEEAKKEREKLMELKAAQDEETKQLEELAKGKKGEFKRTMEALEARAKEHKDTAAAYASELLGMQAEVNGLERKLREAERNQFFSDGDELQLDTARRRLRIARQLEDEYRRQLDDKAEFLRLQTHLLADVEDGTKEDQADLAQSLSDAVEADAGNIRGAVGAGRQPVMPQLRRDDAFPSLTAMLNKLKLKDQQDVNQPTLQHNNYQAETAQPAPLPKSANEFLSFVIPKGTPGQPMPPGFYGGPAQQAGARPAPADPTMAAFWAPTTADPTVFKRRTPVPTQEFSTSAVSQAFTADPVQQFQATQQLLAQLQEQQQYLRQAALGAGAGYAGQNDDTTSAVLGMAAAKISALSASGGIVPTSAATAGDGDGHLAQASAAVGPKVMARIIVPLVHQTGLSKDIVINAVMTLKSRRGKLSGFNEEGLRNAVLDILIEEGHVRVAGVESPAPPPRPPIVLRPAPPPQCSVWNVAEVKQAGPAEFSGETSSECVICGDPLSALRREKLPCGHEYHAQCVRKWFNQKASCPLCCRHVVLDSEYPQLH